LVDACIQNGVYSGILLAGHDIYGEIQAAVPATGNYWKDKNNDWLGPRQILEAIGNHTGTVNWEEIIQNYPAWEDEINKIKRADYQTHPILIIGKSDVIDGMHRLTKAKIDGTQQIKIKRFQSMPENVFIP
jgi:hypothetical protein